MNSPMVSSCRRVLTISFLLAVVGLVGACAHAAPLKRTQDAFREGDLVQTQGYLDRLIASRGDGSMAVITWLEAGKILQTLGRYEESNEALTRAIELMEEYDERASVRVGQEAKATLTHQGLLDYEGKPYDRILAYALRAENSMMLGQWENVRPDIIAAHFAQQEAVRLNQKRIERAQEEIDEARREDEEEAQAYDLEQANSDTRFASALEENFGDLQNFGGYTDYVNPYVEWLSGVYYLAMAQDTGDYGQARVSFDRVAGMVPDNTFILADSTDAKAAESGQGCGPLTWIVFATGTAPSRSTIRIDLPVFLVSGKVDYVGAAFPRLVFHHDYEPELIVRTNKGESIRTVVVCDVDGIVAQDFRNELPVIIAKTLFSTAVKAGIAYGIHEATKGNPWLHIGARITTATYQISQNQADLRTWATLPKQYQVCRVSTPDDGILALAIGNGTERTVGVAPGGFNFVHVRSIRANGELIVNSVPLEGRYHPTDQRYHPTDQVAMD